MARSRMIRPEFWDDEKLALISRDARLVYIALWNFSDDYGVVKGHLAWLKNNIFPYDVDLKIDDFGHWLKELESAGRILEFCENSEKFFFLPKFSKHQTINRPSKTRNPSPPETLTTCSRHTHDILIDETETETETEVKQKTPLRDACLDKKTRIFEKRVGNHLEPILERCKAILSLAQKNGKKFNPYQFVQSAVNDSIHPAAIVDALDGIKKQWAAVSNPWTYGQKILKVNSGNYCEREHTAECEKFKTAWDCNEEILKLTRGIGEI